MITLVDAGPKNHTAAPAIPIKQQGPPTIRLLAGRFGIVSQPARDDRHDL
jgi:hypothetical protein